MIRIAWSPLYAHPLPAKHRFPMEKYVLLHGQLMHEGLVTDNYFFNPSTVDDQVILRVHDTQYLQRLRLGELTSAEERRSGFPYSVQLIEREINILSGTVACVHHAIAAGIAFNIAGGTHHAYADRAEGFCLLNDQAIAARYAVDQGLAQRVAIIDLDVHQGNGTASIFEFDQSVFTFSMHGHKNYPMHKEKSDWDIALEDDTSDEVYLAQLERALDKIWDEFQPDFIFYQAGVDVLASDKLGRLGLSMEGCKKRDELVLEKARLHQIPVVVCMGGGYSSDVRIILDAHMNTFRTAFRYFEP